MLNQVAGGELLMGGGRVTRIISRSSAFVLDKKERLVLDDPAPREV